MQTSSLNYVTILAILLFYGNQGSRELTSEIKHFKGVLYDDKGHVLAKFAASIGIKDSNEVESLE